MILFEVLNRDGLVASLAHAEKHAMAFRKRTNREAYFWCDSRSSRVVVRSMLDVAEALHCVVCSRVV